MSEFRKKIASFPVSCSDIMLVQSLWNSKGMNLGSCFSQWIHTEELRSHNSSICERHRSRVLATPVSDTFTRKKTKQKNAQKNQKKKQTCDKDRSNQHSIKEARCSDMLCRSHLLFQRQIISACVRPCPSVWRSADRLCERAPSKTNTGQLHGPPPPSFKHPQGPRHVWRTATAPLQGGRADCGAPAT